MAEPDEYDAITVSGAKAVAARRENPALTEGISTIVRVALPRAPVFSGTGARTGRV